MHRYKLEGRLETTNAAAVEKELFDAKEQFGELELDLENLQYVSSSGLRVFLKLAKNQPSGLTVLNVKPEVYEILETTGFTSILKVKRAMRTISVEGCQKLGQGGNGAVYRLDDETIVKVYREDISLETIEQEKENTKKALINGVPTMIAFDTVKVGNSYGNVYELMNSDTLSNAIKNHPEKYDELIDKYVAFVKNFATLKAPKGTFPSFKQNNISYMDSVKNYFSKEDFDFVVDILESIKEGDSIIHGDLHPGNIMLQNDELMVIDMAEISTGFPEFELVCIYRDLVSATQSKDNTIERSVGLDRATIRKIFDDFIRKYLGTDDEKIIQGYVGKLALLHSINVIPMLGSGGPEILESFAPLAKERVIDKTLRPYEAQIKGLLSSMG